MFGEFNSDAAFAKTSAELILAADEPPTVNTNGKLAVPPKSPANLILPNSVVVASGVTLPPTVTPT